MTTREIGMLKMELIAKPRTHNSQNRESTPEFTSVIMKVMINDMTTDVNVANRSSRYFSDTIKLPCRTNSAFMGEKAFVNDVRLKKL